MLPSEYLLSGLAGLLVLNTVLIIWILARSHEHRRLADRLAEHETGGERAERNMREEINRSREELLRSLQGFGGGVSTQMMEIAALQTAQLETFSRQLQTLTTSNEQRLETLRETVELRLNRMQGEASETAARTREEHTKTLQHFAQGSEQKLEHMRQTIEAKLAALQSDNSAKLEQMRVTVDEKLHATLEQRLGESFKLVSERLEQVHSGLGEMRTLATGVGDLKKVLTNIKTRGSWGEVQLGNLLEQVLTPDQFERNVITVPGSNDRVEYAVKLPGKAGDQSPLWLPIDAKFPQEEYQRLVDAQDRGDVEAAELAAFSLERGVRLEAKKIAEKYVSPPHTTDFAIMFLPTEGLFAEVLRRPGLSDSILLAHRVVISGPTTLAAVLSSLQMGFRTLAIEKRSGEVWKILGEIKTEFSKFGGALEKVQKKLQEATNSIDSAAQRSRALQRKLGQAHEAPELRDEGPLLLEIPDSIFPVLPEPPATD